MYYTSAGHRQFIWIILFYWRHMHMKSESQTVAHMVCCDHVRFVWQPENPGGHSQYILVGVCRGTSKKGGLRHGHNPKRGVLGTGTTQKRGVLGTGTSQKRGVLGTGKSRKKRGGGGLMNWSCKKTILVTDVAQKGGGGLGAYLLITLTFFLSTWSIGGGLLWQTNKEGS